MKRYHEGLRVISLNDGCVNMRQFVKVDSRRSIQVLFLYITIGLLVPQNQVNL